MLRDTDGFNFPSRGDKLDDGEYTKCWRCGHKVGVGCICPICASVNRWKFSTHGGKADNVERDSIGEEGASSSSMKDFETAVEWDRGEYASKRISDTPWSFELTCGVCRRVDDDGTWLLLF